MILMRHLERCKAVILAEYPEIIYDLVKKAESYQSYESYELRLFDLSDFMSGPPLEDVYNKIDKSMRFFSVYVVMEQMRKG